MHWLRRPPLAFEFSVAVRFLKEGRFQSLLIVVGVAAVLISSFVGGIIGLAAGYFRRRIETVSKIQR